MKKNCSKIIVTLLICLSVILSYEKVSAKEIYFTNQNGVSLTREEYDFLSDLYWDGYQNIILEEQYQKLVSHNLIGREIESKSIVVNNGPFTRGTSHTTYAKRLKISKLCGTTGSECLISTRLEWLGTPVVKGYDVIGSVLDGVTMTEEPSTVVSTPVTTYFIDEEDTKMFNNGFGTSLLIADGADPIITQDFYCTGSGHVYSSYQHAMKALTKEESKQYKISGIGFGGVFEFSGKAKELYDDMNGVDIAV